MFYIDFILSTGNNEVRRATREITRAGSKVT